MKRIAAPADVPMSKGAALASTVGISLVGTPLHSLSYREIDIDESLPPGDEIFELEAQVILFPPDAAEFRLNVRIQPNKPEMAFELQASMSSRFLRLDKTPTRAFIEFVSTRGGIVLFPYLRELVANITNRTVFDEVSLDPMALDTAITQDEIAAMTRVMDQEADKRSPINKTGGKKVVQT